MTESEQAEHAAGSKRDFFISYAEEDRSWAEWTAWQLEQAGYSTVLQAWHFTPGADFIHEMQKAVIGAERLIAVYSHAYFASPYTEVEWRSVLARDPAGERRLLVPVRVEACDPPGLLVGRVYIDLFGVSEATAKARLLAHLRTGPKPRTSPEFPGLAGSTTERPGFVGELPRVWNVPYPRHTSFVGRDELLQAVRDGFAGASRLVLTGLDGVGKTQLAVEYAYRHRADYGLVWWVRADAKATLVGDCAGLGAEVGLPDHADQDATIEAVRGWLARERGWLLVLHNADDPAAVRDLLPLGGDGHVLLTSRREVDWHGVATPVTVDPLGVEEATELLLARTGSQDRASARELALALGCLPFALEQAGAVIAQGGVVKIDDYLGRFRKRSSELLAQGQQAGDGSPTFTATWELSLQQLRKQSQAAVDLLDLAAFLAPEDLPWQQLVDHGGLLPGGLGTAARDTVALGEVVTALRRHSLAKVAGGSVSVNRLLQSVVRERLKPSEQRRWSGVAVRLLLASFPEHPDDADTWPECQRLLPHALSVGEHAAYPGVEPDQHAELLSRVIDYLRVRGQPLQARTAVEAALRRTATGSRPEPASRAVLRRAFGRVLHDLGDLHGARAQLQQALEIDEKAYGPKSQRVAEDRRYLGRILRELGDLEGAKWQLDWALSIDEEAWGLRNERVAEDRRHLASVLQNLGNLPGAKAQICRALRIDTAIFGPEHPRTAGDRRQLGLILRDLGELPQARAELERALAIDTAAFGDDHWLPAEDHRSLATVLRELGDYQGARAQLERALEIDETLYNPEDWRSAQDRRYLGTVLLLLDRYEEAREQLQRAREIDEETFGRDHWRVAQDLRHLGLALRGTRDLDKARATLERALEIDETVYGPGDWRVAEDRRYLSRVLRDLGRPNDARTELERALAVDEETFGPDHWRTAQDRRFLSNVLWELGELAEAQTELERAREILEHVHDNDHPMVIAINTGLDQLRRELDERGPTGEPTQ